MRLLQDRRSPHEVFCGMLTLLDQAPRYILQHPEAFRTAVETHLQLSASALAIAASLCLPVGILIARRGPVCTLALETANTLRVIPSLAVLALLLPLAGTGMRPALIALVILACPPILINTVAGFR